MIFNTRLSNEYQLTYGIVGGGAVIVKYEGDEDNVVIPDHLENYPVTKIEPYAFSEKCMKYLHLPKNLKVIDHHGFSGCPNLVRIDFPPQLTTVGNYAFYNCLNLETVHLTPFIKSIGFGAFMNCEKIHHIIQDRIEGQPLSLGSLTDELMQQIRVEMNHLEPDGTCRSAKITLTEYTAVVIADAAAIASACKQFISEYSGSGRNLRFCISKDGVDYKKYDSMFPQIVHNDSFAIASIVAMDRLLYPLDLSAAAKETYLTYMKEHASQAITKFLKDDDLPRLTALLDMELPDAPCVDAGIELAMQLGKTEYTAQLMNYKHRKFSFEEEEFLL